MIIKFAFKALEMCHAKHCMHSKRPSADFFAWLNRHWRRDLLQGTPRAQTATQKEIISCPPCDASNGFRFCNATGRPDAAPEAHNEAEMHHSDLASPQTL
jgi:hypothetical protein